MRKKRKRRKERGGGEKNESHNTHSMTREPQMKQNLIRLEDELSKHISCLKHRETTLAKTVKSAPLGVLAGRESASKYLHSEEGKNEDEQNEQDEQGVDRGDRVHEGLYQVSHRAPVSEECGVVII